MDDSILTLDDLSADYREIAEVIGIQKLYNLCAMYGGTQIYIPRKSELLKNKIYELIKLEFNGSNRKELSRKYNVSESTVYRLVRQKGKKQ